MYGGAGWASSVWSQVRESLGYSWLIVSVPLLAAAILPLIAPASTIQAITPHCVWKTHFGRECPACGLTTAFLHIRRGEWRTATRSNAAGIPVYAIFILNSLFWLRSIARLTRFHLIRLKHVHT